MSHYFRQLSEESETALRTALGKNVGLLFPEAWLDVTREGAVVSSVSISLGHRSYLIIENEWADTPIGFMDYYSFSASLSDRPKDIRVTEDTGPGWLHHHVSTIHTWSPTIIDKITVYETSDSFEEEAIRYDSAILFDYEAGQILLTPDRSITGYIAINYKPNVIIEIIATMKYRKEIQ
ncbi:MAG TPA: hypothetical protein DEP46_13805 [Blastocatellia bacterium]|nr:hypothetical protein [Blastocatellia bacterium]